MWYCMGTPANASPSANDMSTKLYLNTLCRGFCTSVLFIALAVVTNATLISFPQKIPVRTSVTYCVEASQNFSNCKTWNEYLAAQSKYFTTNVAFYFLPGVHVHLMNQSLTVSGSSNLLFFCQFQQRCDFDRWSLKVFIFQFLEYYCRGHEHRTMYPN